MKRIIYIIPLLVVMILSCEGEKEEPMQAVEFDETPYELEFGDLPPPNIPPDNALTQQGVELGRMLFFEKKLSLDGSQSCASCHNQKDGFSDTLQFSVGVEMLEGKRQAMPIFNMGWHSNEFFWDGRAQFLREQSLEPIEDPLEMNETLENVIAKLNEAQIYKDQFTRAFGSEEITAEKMSLAMEQFMLSIVSYDSKYDQFLAGLTELSESEERGRILFETEFNPFFPDMSGADCAHCHGGANFENDQYMNNGLDVDADFIDLGREIATGNIADRAKFKVPSLRNIAVTQPYMHDGRFNTLEEVIEHYDLHMKQSSTLDPALIQVIDNGGLHLTDQDKLDLVNFLKTLTDQTFLNNPEYSDPF